MNLLYRPIQMKSSILTFPLTLLTFVALFAAISAQAQTVDTLYSFFSNSNTQAIEPFGTIAQGRDGNFYGISQSGNGCCQGWFYKISPGGALTSLHAMAQTEGTNCAGLTLGTDGNFYGACPNGGIQNGNPGGTIIRVTPAGAVTVMHGFPEVGSTTDGCSPYGPPIQGTDGNFYGFATGCGTYGAGMAYKFTLAGVYTQLYNFQGGSADIQYPYGSPVQGSDGNFWGLGNTGGHNTGCGGCGGVFKMTSTGKETLIYSFNGSTDGQGPYDSLIQGSDGNYYGTTLGGGGSFIGTVFKVTPKGVETILYNFPNQTDGAYPRLPLTQGPDGLLYGMATDCAGGGCAQAGLFTITTKGVYDNLYLYPIGGSNSLQPSSALVLSTNGTFYGTTEQGGANDVGSLYSVSTKYSPFISLLNVIGGKEGTQVGILGQGFSSSSVVKFGGTVAATKTLTGSTFILATIPAGALTGSVTVTTGTTTLASRKSFSVNPTSKTFSPASGPVGTVVTITGTGFTQATKVTFNKIVATFTVVSDTEVTATVPTGATTGKIVVFTKGGSASSTTNFTVN
jgi:uncharacterized repeat protein (TIGR03803 family)